jgi:hypothetical protein
VVGGTGGGTYRAFKDEMTLPTVSHWILEDVGTFGDRHPGTKDMSVLTVVWYRRSARSCLHQDGMDFCDLSSQRYQDVLPAEVAKVFLPKIKIPSTDLCHELDPFLAKQIVIWKVIPPPLPPHL